MLGAITPGLAKKQWLTGFWLPERRILHFSCRIANRTSLSWRNQESECESSSKSRHHVSFSLLTFSSTCQIMTARSHSPLLLGAPWHRLYDPPVDDICMCESCYNPVDSQRLCSFLVRLTFLICTSCRRVVCLMYGLVFLLKDFALLVKKRKSIIILLSYLQ